jgi:hypothetical protein
MDKIDCYLVKNGGYSDIPTAEKSIVLSREYAQKDILSVADL